MSNRKYFTLTQLISKMMGPSSMPNIDSLKYLIAEKVRSIRGLGGASTVFNMQSLAVGFLCAGAYTSCSLSVPNFMHCVKHRMLRQNVKYTTDSL